MILKAGIGILIFFVVLRFRNVPEAFLALGILVNLDRWMLALLLPWLRRGNNAEGSPLRSQFYAGLVTLLAVVLGVVLFSRFAGLPVLPDKLKGHTKQVNVVVFSPGAERFASAGEDDFIRLWKFDDGSKKYVDEKQLPEANHTPTANTISRSQVLPFIPMVRSRCSAVTMGRFACGTFASA